MIFVLFILLYINIQTNYENIQTSNDKYDVLITQKNFVCWENDFAYAFCLKNGFNFPCSDFSADVPYETFSRGILKIYPLRLTPPPSSINFGFKDIDGTEIRKEININYYCFYEIKPHIVEIKEQDDGTLKITSRFHIDYTHVKQIKAEGMYGKVITSSFENEVFSIIYKRRFNYPYRDVIFLNFVGDVNFLSYIYFPVHSFVQVPGETEPFSKIRAKTKYASSSTSAGPDGKFIIDVKIFPGDKYINIDIIDKFGNKTSERIKLDYSDKTTDFIEDIYLGDKVVIFTNRKAQEEQFTKISDHIYFFSLQKPGILSLTFGDRKYILSKRNFPAFLSVYSDFNQREIFADGTSVINFLVKITDIYMNEVDWTVNVEYKYDEKYIEFERERNKFYFLLKKKSGDKLNISFYYEFLRYDLELLVLPGLPDKIVIFPDKSYVYGDGKDKIKILVSLQDRVGNIVPSDIDVSTDFGNIYRISKESGELEVFYSADSKIDVKPRILFKYGNIEQEFSPYVFAKRQFFELSPAIGVLNNFGKLLIPTPVLRISYARLISGRYFFSSIFLGYFYSKIQDVSFNTVYSILDLSLNLMWDMRFGANVIFFSRLAKFGDISEDIIGIAPGVNLGYSTRLSKLNFFFDVLLFFPEAYQKGQFITVEGSFERLLFIIGYVFEL